jgi:hypothetical protein
MERYLTESSAADQWWFAREIFPALRTVKRLQECGRQNLILRLGATRPLTVVDFRTGAGVATASGYFLVLGQIKRHGSLRTVAVKSLVLRNVACRSGPRLSSWESRLSSADFNLSDDTRKFARVHSDVVVLCQLIAQVFDVGERF